MKPLLLIIASLFLVTCIRHSFSANNQLVTPAHAGCSCPGENLIFICIVTNGRATIWEGSAFDCPGNQDEILLLHSDPGAFGVCNGGAIVGKSVSTDGTCYTSQLNVTVIHGVHNKTVMCSESSNSQQVGVSQIKVAAVLYQDAPSGVQLTNVSANELTFSWTPVDPNCLPSSHVIMFDCGTCHSTSETTATCTDLQIPNTCNFSIQNVVCGQVGSASDPMTVTLRVPNKPSVTIVPVYSADTQILIRFYASIEQQAPFNISDGISGSVVYYNFSYPGSSTLISSCGDSRCEYMIPSFCSQSSSINVTISAFNRLGLGMPSNLINLGCVNQFVEVSYNSALSVIVCQFLNQTDASKSCTITYGQCDVDFDNLECYNVTASSDGVIVIVQGQTLTSTVFYPGSSLIAVIVLVVIILIIIILTVCIILTLTVIKRRHKKPENIQRKVEVSPDIHHDMSTCHRWRLQHNIM